MVKISSLTRQARKKSGRMLIKVSAVDFLFIPVRSLLFYSILFFHPQMQFSKNTLFSNSGRLFPKIYFFILSVHKQRSNFNFTTNNRQPCLLMMEGTVSFEIMTRICPFFFCAGWRCVWVLLHTDTSIYTGAPFHQPGKLTMTPGGHSRVQTWHQQGSGSCLISAALPVRVCVFALSLYFSLSNAQTSRQDSKVTITTFWFQLKLNKKKSTYISTSHLWVYFSVLRGPFCILYIFQPAAGCITLIKMFQTINGFNKRS